MNPDLVEGIIQEVRATWPTVNDLEITLEANPGSVEAARFELYRQAGVNRVSVGVQALRDDALKALGRLHSTRDALNALETAKNIFDRVSFDLIYARQNQTLNDWKRELDEAISVAGDHLSLYQLTVEEGTVFAERASRGGLKGLPEEDLAADMFELTQDICNAAGLPAYEVSNHARPGAESRHNMIYWRCGDYVGIGPGAHGRITKTNGRWATEAFRDPNTWLNTDNSGESGRVALSSADFGLEYLLMSLRTNEGLNIARYLAMTGQVISEQKLIRLEELGLVRRTSDRIRTSNSGRLVLNSILRELAAD